MVIWHDIVIDTVFYQSVFYSHTRIPSDVEVPTDIYDTAITYQNHWRRTEMIGQKKYLAMVF